MMKYCKFLLLGWFVCLLAGLCACTQSTPTVISAYIQSFSFSYSAAAPDAANTTFTVDNTAMTIYNKDSIRYFSNLSKLKPNITLYGAAYSIEIKGEVWNRKDSLDFSVSPVEIKVTASDKKTTCTYNLYVNKHQVNPDSVTWKQQASTMEGLPENVQDYRVVRRANGAFYMLAEKGDGASVLRSSDGQHWMVCCSTNQHLQAASLTALADTLLMTDKDQTSSLYRYDESTQSVVLWQSLGTVQCQALLGAGYSKVSLLGQEQGSRKLYVADGRTLQSQELPTSAFPVQGAARMSWKKRSLYLIGGEDATGNRLQSCMASENGLYWVNLVKSASYAFPVCTNATAFMLEDEVFLMGGTWKEGEGMPLYVSFDNGYSWGVAASYQQPPATLQNRSQASAVLDEESNVWIFGGKVGGTLLRDVWKGRINKSDFILR